MMIEHLILSTIVLALAMVAARALPVTARTRHAMLLCGLAKFAVPSSLFRSIGVQTVNVLPTPALMQGFTATARPAEAPGANWLLIGWAAVAALLFGRWLLLRSRTVAAALRSPSAPSQRELEALAGARRILRIRTAVDLLRSPLCEAPAVVRVIRPVVLLPAHGCDDLSDGELRSLLLHELAHVGRRDNLTAVFLALASSLLWFHPLVWLALRRLDAAREQACDERVAEAMEQTDTYLDALTKVCRALLAPRTAGASCMAGANVKERMEHLMRYETLRSRAWSHRGILAVSLLAILATAVFAGEVRLQNQNLYSLKFDITPEEHQVIYNVSIIDNASGLVVSTPRVRADWGQAAAVKTEHLGRHIELQLRMERGRAAELFLIVKEGDGIVQQNLYTWDPQPAVASGKDPDFSGEPISVTLKQADIRDVMHMFTDITRAKIVVDEAVEGTVTIDVRNMPWDQALVECARQVGANVKVEGKTIRITK